MFAAAVAVAEFRPNEEKVPGNELARTMNAQIEIAQRKRNWY